MNVVILQSSYVPWKGYFDLIRDADVFVFYDEAKYTKNDWRNRNRIRSKNGSHWLTIPLSKDAVKLKISEVPIVGERWQEHHYNMLAVSYRRAPFFSQLEPFMEDFYRARTWDSLSQLNQHSVKAIAAYLGITTRFRDSREFKLIDNRVGRLIGILEQLGATRYVTGPSARAYLSGFEELFARRSIELVFKDYSGYPAYRQLCSPFDPHVSILDLLANVRREEIAEKIWAWRGLQTPAR